MSLVLIVGLVGVAFLFLYFAFQLSKDEYGEDQHFFLKLLLIFLFFITIQLVPKAALDARTTCTPVVSATLNDAPYTNYTYTEQCVVTSNNTEVSFLRIAQWSFRIFGLYILVFFFWYFAKRNERMARLIEDAKRRFE